MSKKLYKIYKQEYLSYFKKGKIDLSLLEIEELILLIRKEYIKISKDNERYRLEKLKLVDQINRCGDTDKAFGVGVPFLFGFILSKSIDFLASYGHMGNGVIQFITNIVIAIVVTGVVIYSSMSSKRVENFYRLCFNVLEDLHDDAKENSNEVVMPKDVKHGKSKGSKN